MFVVGRERKVKRGLIESPEADKAKLFCHFPGSMLCSDAIGIAL
jgi:hypothetical protein